MEHSFDHAHFWTALSQGGEVARSAIENYRQLPELKRESVVEQLFRQASRTIDDLLELERVKNRVDFTPKKNGLCTLLESLPALVTTPEGRANATKQVQAIDVKSRELMDMDILMKCDEVETTLKRAGTAMGIPTTGVIEVTSIKDLEKQLGVELPPEVIKQIEKSGGAVILGVMGQKKNAS